MTQRLDIRLVALYGRRTAVERRRKSCHQRLQKIRTAPGSCRDRRAALAFALRCGAAFIQFRADEYPAQHICEIVTDLARCLRHAPRPFRIVMRTARLARADRRAPSSTDCTRRPSANVGALDTSPRIAATTSPSMA